MAWDVAAWEWPLGDAGSLWAGPESMLAFRWPEWWGSP